MKRLLVCLKNVGTIYFCAVFKKNLLGAWVVQIIYLTWGLPPVLPAGHAGSRRASRWV